MKEPRFSIKAVQAKVREFRLAVDDATDPHELVAAKRMLERYMRAIEKKILSLPMSSMSRRIIENEHKISYKYD